MDKIILKGLPVGCVIGTLPAERTAPQTLFFDLELYGDFSRAGRTDDLNDAVDYTAVERCVKDLRGFAKTKLLKPGESEVVTVELSSSDFAYFDELTHQFTTDPGKYDILVGVSSRDIRGKGTVELGAAFEAFRRAVIKSL